MKAKTTKASPAKTKKKTSEQQLKIPLAPMARLPKQTDHVYPLQNVNDIVNTINTQELLENRTTMSVVYSDLLEKGLSVRLSRSTMSLIEDFIQKGKLSDCGRYMTLDLAKAAWTRHQPDFKTMYEWKNFLDENGFVKEFYSQYQPIYVRKSVAANWGGYAKPKTYALDLQSFDKNKLTLITSYTEKVIHDIKLPENYVVDASNIRLVQTIQDTEIDLKGAIAAEVAHYNTHQDTIKLASRLNNILKLVCKQRTLSISPKVNRVYHSLSHVSKEARPYLNCHGKTFIELDVRNSQPLLAVAYCKQNGLEVDEQFIQHVEDGTLYELFVGVTGNFTYKYKTYDRTYTTKFATLYDRAEIKNEIFHSVFFEFIPTNPINVKFMELFPKTHASLQTLRNVLKKQPCPVVSGDSNTLAAELQRLEGKIIGKCRPETGSYFTLHDAIFVTDKDSVPGLVEDLKKSFEEYGVSPQIRVSESVVSNSENYIYKTIA